MLSVTNAVVAIQSQQVRVMLPHCRRLLILSGFALAPNCFGWAIASEIEPQWNRSPWFEETSFTAALEPNLRINVNAPLDADGKPAKATRLIVFALPNGNTIEQTLGCKLTEGMDWHYDIQHIGAQVRLLRETMPDEKIVLICAEAGGLTWPNWRKNTPDANKGIAAFVDAWRRQFGTEDCKVTLTGHSGGGSFDFGVIEGADEIPGYIDRIALLDSNYSFDAKLHGEKLERWLKSDDSHRLIVLCYDDRNIELNGKKVVGPTGGTFRATDRMRESLGPHFPLTETVNPPFTEYSGLDGRIHFYVHPNPENKILHTVLVGEMNGLLHVQTLGTRNETTWGKFGGPRAYTKFVQPEPTKNEAAEKTAAEKKAAAKKMKSPLPFQLPSRPAGAMEGAAFIKSLEGLNRADRETAILKEITSGNFPGFLRKLKTVPIHSPGKDGKQIAGTIEVMPDYLAVGSDDDFVRMPMMPQTAQQIADGFGCVLPTRAMVNAIDEQAEVRLEPRPMTEQREAVCTFLEHNEIIERQRDGKELGLLLTGIKKDIVLTPRIFEKPKRVAIYGWRKLDGKPIQDLTIVHVNWYVDYSHGVRLVRNTIAIDGKQLSIPELLADKERSSLVSDEGPMVPPRYPEE